MARKNDMLLQYGALISAVGGINWVLVAFGDYNLVTELFSNETLQNTVYGLVGASSTYVAGKIWGLIK